METASFAGFIKIIFYIIIFYYVIKFVARLLLPLLIKKAVEKAGENFQQQNPYSQTRSASINDDTIYNTSKTEKPRETKKVGEYVDYEELEN